MICRKKPDLQNDKENSKPFQFCWIILLALFLGGCATFPSVSKEITPPSSLPGFKEKARPFPEFIAVVAQEGDTFS